LKCEIESLPFIVLLYKKQAVLTTIHSIILYTHKCTMLYRNVGSPGINAGGLGMTSSCDVLITRTFSYI